MGNMVGLCGMCPNRNWAMDEFDDEDLYWMGWRWCRLLKDMIHISFGCSRRRTEMKPKRISLAVRLGIKPNEQGEYF